MTAVAAGLSQVCLDLLGAAAFSGFCELLSRIFRAAALCCGRSPVFCLSTAGVWALSPACWNARRSLSPAGVLYLVLEFCSIPVCHVLVPGPKLRALLSLLAAAIRKHAAGRRLIGYEVAKITGTLQSMRFAVSPVSLFTRALYRWQSELPKDAAQHIVFSNRRRLTAEASLELKFWSHQLASWNGATLRPGTFSRVLYTDASGAGWGGLVQRVLARSEEPASMLAAVQWEDLASVDSVLTELQGLRDALIMLISSRAHMSYTGQTQYPHIGWWLMLAPGGVRGCPGWPGTSGLYACSTALPFPASMWARMSSSARELTFYLDGGMTVTLACARPSSDSSGTLLALSM